jgi:hypothetical protein
VWSMGGTMKRTAIAIAAVLAGACGGSSSGGGTCDGTKNLCNFDGAPWNGTVITTVTCPGQAPVSASGSGGIQLFPGSGADLQYSSAAGCLFKFNVSGATATLANAPVSCTSSGTQLSFTSYTLATLDGHSLRVNSAGTAIIATQTCSFTVSGTLTR